MISRRAWRLLFAGDEVPGGVVRARQGEHVPDGDLIGLPLAPVAPVLGVHLVALVEGGLAVAEAAQLLLLADVEPELEDDDPVLGQLALELVELAVGPPPFRLARKSLQALDEDPAVPGAVVDRDHPGPGHVPPEPPQVMVGLLLVGGLRDRDHPEVAGVDRVGEPAGWPRPCPRRPSPRRPTRPSAAPGRPRGRPCSAGRATCPSSSRSRPARACCRGAATGGGAAPRGAGGRSCLRLRPRAAAARPWARTWIRKRERRMSATARLRARGSSESTRYQGAPGLVGRRCACARRAAPAGRSRAGSSSPPA